MFAAVLCMSMAWAQDPGAPAPEPEAVPPTATEAAPVEAATGDVAPAQEVAAPAEAAPTEGGFVETTPPAADGAEEADAGEPSPALLRRRGVGIALTGVGITFAAGSLGFGIAGLLNSDGMGGALLGVGALIHVVPAAAFLGSGIPLWVSADRQLGRSLVTIAPVVGPGNVGVQGRF
jgi:hypothetical protein